MIDLHSSEVSFGALSNLSYVYMVFFPSFRSPGRSVSIVNRLQSRLARFDSWLRHGFFSSPLCTDWLWGPPSLPFNGYQGFFPQGQSNQDMKLTTCLHLWLKLRMCGVILPLPLCL